MPKLKEVTLGGNQMVQAQQIHCPGCGRFIGYQAIVWGMVKIKCPNCRQWITIDILKEK